MVIRDSHLNLLVLPYKKQTIVVLCSVREALAEVRPNTAPLGRSAPGTLRERKPLGGDEQPRLRRDWSRTVDEKYDERFNPLDPQATYRMLCFVCGMGLDSRCRSNRGKSRG